MRDRSTACSTSPARLRRALLPIALSAASLEATESAPPCDVVAVSAGSHHNLDTLSDGTIRAWGANTYTQLGGPATADFEDTPVAVLSIGQALPGALTVAAGGFHSLALLADGTVWAWGFNGFGQLGKPPCIVEQSRDPLPVDDPSDPTAQLTGVVAIAAGSHHSLAVKADGTVVGWGQNDTGQLGDGTSNLASVATPVGFVTRAVAVSAGHAHSLALASTGEVWSWGYNADGQLGRDLPTGTFWTSDPARVQTPAGTLGGVKAISGSTSGNFALALLAGGTLVGWGSDADGQLGFGPLATRARAEPILIDATTPLGDLKAIAAGGRHALALTSCGEVWAWGSNLAGQLGSTSSASWRSQPMKVLLDSDNPNRLTGVSLIADGSIHSAAFVAGGQIETFGLNSQGELGNVHGNLPDTVPPSEPHGGGKPGDTAVYAANLACSTWFKT